MQRTACIPFREEHLCSQGIVLHMARLPTPPSQSSPRGQVARGRVCPRPQRRSRGDRSQLTALGSLTPMKPGEFSEQLTCKDRGPDMRQQPQFSASASRTFLGSLVILRLLQIGLSHLQGTVVIKWAESHRETESTAGFPSYLINLLLCPREREEQHGPCHPRPCRVEWPLERKHL